ncbi:MAG: flagellar biosynthetic protein FliR [Candidatus Lernaella stagnicola]|nr:flagellar biosynthetic protein FliR [Candidatus Lernaella stagnicola]
MPLFSLPVGAIELYMLVYLRVLGLLTTLPVFGGSEIPRSLKAGLVAAFALVVAVGLIAKGPITVPAVGFYFMLGAAKELIFGLMCGWLISWVVQAAIIGMQMVGFQMGFAIVNVVDPSTGSAISIMATLHARLAVIVFIVSGIYRPFLQAIADSFTIVPLGAVVFHPSQAQMFIETLDLAFKTSITIAGAPIAALLLSKIGLGVIARTVPQMNVFIVGFPLTIGIGLIVTAVGVPYFVHGIDAMYQHSLTRMLQFMATAAP